MRSQTTQFVVANLLAVTLLCSVDARGDVFFRGLGGLRGPDSSSSAFAISSDGSTVVGKSDSNKGIEGFVWTEAEGMRGLGDLPGGNFESFANDVSTGGPVAVGRSISGSGFEAFRWTMSTGMVGLGDLPGGSFSSLANSVSYDGTAIVGTGRSANGTEAFRWTEDGMVGLGDLPGWSFLSDGLGISGDGSTVVGSSNSNAGQEAFRWTAATGMVGLGDLPGGSFTSTARAASRDGSVIVGWSNSDLGQEAFRWTEAQGMVALGDLPGGSHTSSALAVSADGSTVVGFGRTDRIWSAFIWDEKNGMRELHNVLSDLGLEINNWRLTEATGISADGKTIVGRGIRFGAPRDVTMGWVAHIGPRSAKIDVKPGSCPNPLNRNSRGKLPVAVVGTSEFDVSMIDVESLVLTRSDGIGGIVSPLNGPPGPRVRIEDVATPFEGEPCDCHALQGDGVDDLSMKFDTQTLVAELELNDLPGGAEVELVISGQLIDGTDFSGSDCIRLVPPNGGELGFVLNDGQSTVGDIQPKPSPTLGAPKENAEGDDESTTQAADLEPIGCGGIMPSLLFVTLAGMWLMARRLPRPTMP